MIDAAADFRSDGSSAAVSRTAGAEVLVTKAGAGTLRVGSVPLPIREAEPLLASD